MNFPYLKETARKVADAFGLSYDDGVKIVGFYSSRGNDSGVDACAALDLETIKAAADAVGVVLRVDHGSKADSVKDNGSRAADAETIKNKDSKPRENTPKKPDNIKDDKNNAKSVNTPKKENNTDNTPAGGAVIALDVVESIIGGYCNKYGIESPEKLSGLQFRAACMLVGQYIKENKLILDKEKTAAQGGRVFDPDKVNSLIDLFGFVAASCKKVPLMSDFAAFAGVSLSWLYDCNGACALTSASGNTLKKLQDMQAAGIGSGIANEQTAQVGRIFFAKSQLGWSDTPGSGSQQDEKIETAAAGLPVFDGSKLLKSPKNP